MGQISLSFVQVLAAIGCVQSFYVMGFLALRPKIVNKRALPLLYFLVLGLAFVLDLGAGFKGLDPKTLFLLQWIFWFSLPPLSVLLILQLSDLNASPTLKDFWVLLLLPFSFLISFLAAHKIGLCAEGQICKDFQDLLSVTGLIPGTISLLVIFSKKRLLENLPRQKYGPARYWLIIALMALNVLLLLLALLSVTGGISAGDVQSARNILGLGFAYTAGTLLLRIFVPESKPAAQGQAALTLDEKERDLVKKIEDLLNLDKVYQEPTYSRMDLARECGVTEALVSKVINIHFGKTFPQLINERRIEDAKRLLRETKAPVAQIAEEVGFNSLPSFNRVFKDFEDVSPSVYRKNILGS